MTQHWLQMFSQLWHIACCGEKVCSFILGEKSFHIIESGHDGFREVAARLTISTIEYESRVEVCYDGAGNNVWYGHH